MFPLCFPCPISVFMPLNLCQPSDHRVFQFSQFLITFNFPVLPFFPLKQLLHFSFFYLGKLPLRIFFFLSQTLYGTFFIFPAILHTKLLIKVSFLFKRFALLYEEVNILRRNSLQIFYNFQCNVSFSFLTFSVIYLISSHILDLFLGCGSFLYFQKYIVLCFYQETANQ